MGSRTFAKDKPIVYLHANNNANFVGGTTTLEDTGIISDVGETYIIFLKVHVSQAGTLKININDSSLFNMTVDANTDHMLGFARTVAANTQVQVQFLGASTASVSSYYIICIPCTPKGV